MKKYLLILIGILLLNSVYAIESVGVFKNNDCIALTQTCDTCSYVNISSIQYPNSSIILENAAMTKSGVLYNYTFCNTSAFGDYLVSGFGDLDGEIGLWTYKFSITPNGEELKLQISILYITLFVFLISLIIVCIYCSIRCTSLLLKWLFINISWYLIIVFTFYIWKVGLNYITGIPFFIPVLRSIFLLEMIATPMLILLSVGFIFVYLLTSHVFRDLVARGQTRDEIVNSDEYGWFYKLMWRYKR